MLFIPGLKQTKNNKYKIFDDKGSKNAITFNKELKASKNIKTIKFNCLRTGRNSYGKRFNRQILRNHNGRILYV